jgi:hypothetical protein
MTELFTDTQGTLHQGTVPRGLVRSEAWEQQKKLAEKVLPEGLATIVKSTRAPFITKVYDVTSTKATFFDDKLFLMGDAQITLSTERRHEHDACSIRLQRTREGHGRQTYARAMGELGAQVGRCTA